MPLDITFKNTIIDNKEARFLQLNTEGEPAHFYGANGFPLGAYSELLKPGRRYPDAGDWPGPAAR